MHVVYLEVMILSEISAQTKLYSKSVIKNFLWTGKINIYKYINMSQVHNPTYNQS